MGNYYQWQPTDTLWGVARQFFSYTGYSNVITLAEAIRAANPNILDWARVPSGTYILLPAVLIT
jgi:phage tail protein X